MDAQGKKTLREVQLLGGLDANSLRIQKKDRLIHKGNREKFIRLFFAGKCEDFRLQYAEKPPLAPIVTALNQRRGTWGVFWKELWKDYNKDWDSFPPVSIRWRKAVPQIITPSDEFHILRNGQDLSTYNYAIYQKSVQKFFWRETVKDAIDLVEILGTEENRLPSLIGLDYGKLNQTTFTKRMRGE